MKRSMGVVGAALAALVLLGAWRASAPAARAQDREREREREHARRQREREYEALQGVWKFLRYEEAGQPVQDGQRRSWVIREHRWAHREKDQTSPDSRLEIDPEDNPRHLDVWDGDTHVISAIYARVGDYGHPVRQSAGRPGHGSAGALRDRDAGRRPVPDRLPDRAVRPGPLTARPPSRPCPGAAGRYPPARLEQGGRPAWRERG